MPAPLIPGRRLTAAEKQRRRREALAARGLVEVSIVCPRAQRAVLEDYAATLVADHEAAFAHREATVPSQGGPRTDELSSTGDARARARPLAPR